VRRRVEASYQTPQPYYDREMLEIKMQKT
jgi:hypothetical protein